MAGGINPPPPATYTDIDNFNILRYLSTASWPVVSNQVVLPSEV